MPTVSLESSGAVQLSPKEAQGSGKASSRSLVTSPETATEQMALAFDYMVTGSYSLRIHVK